jgi:hypothetical protein
MDECTGQGPPAAGANLAALTWPPPPAGEQYWISECKNAFSSSAVSEGYDWLARLADCRTGMYQK